MNNQTRLLISRRQLIQLLTGGLVSGLPLACRKAAEPTTTPLFRFAVASDGHLGEAGTASEQFYLDLINALIKQHRDTPLQFVVINGDLVHENSAALLSKAKVYLDQLPVPYYVTRGNHDRVPIATWQSIWGYATNHVVERPDSTLVLLDTSNEAGDYLCGNSQWLDSALSITRPDKPVFLFMHIPYIRNTTGTDVCGDILTVLNRYPRVRAVFHGHDHTKDFGIILNQTALLFDAHFGSSWGTPYRGFRLVEQSTADRYFTYQYDFINQKRLNELVF